MNTTISADTTVAELVDLWLFELRADGRLENTTINEYERVLRKLVVPDLGSLRLHELTTSRIDVVLAKLAMKGVNRQRKAKVVAGAMLDSALQGGAISANPVRGSMSISRPKPAPRLLMVTDLETLRMGGPGMDDQGPARAEGLGRHGRRHRVDARYRCAHRRGPCAAVE